ncbi:hypothetical protein N0V83_005265 [Neocucurbitaria cava]|uniref:PLC-like phosphodiesterase n=1 Tax=Neocucurbitaria cava TaxID=798079 RepID=A0A9W8YAC9_9PLEO|nr:hypothetical protein N0V83_005265 [Neocucurbitaria cava]
MRVTSPCILEPRNESARVLCHSSCALFDVGPLYKWLWEIRVWLDAHPDEVVTLVLVNIDFVDARELEAEYSKADIAHYGYVPPVIDKAPPPSTKYNSTWPTLGEMIDKGERLVTFVNALVPDKDNAPYLLNEFDFIWENQYDITSLDDFACTPDRPSNTTSIAEEHTSGKLFMMNHLLYWQQAFGIQIPDTRKITATNSWDGPGGLGTHMIQCGSQVGRQPTFVLVDFFNVGPAIDAVDIFNGVRQPVGRLNVTTEVTDGTTMMRKVNGGGRSVRAPVLAMVVIALGTILRTLA